MGGGCCIFVVLLPLPPAFAVLAFVNLMVLDGAWWRWSLGLILLALVVAVWMWDPAGPFLAVIAASFVGLTLLVVLWIVFARVQARQSGGDPLPP